MTSLNVVALISGGKDSFFSILHCIANGHKIVALANLHPPVGDVEDTDSFMYQTVGHSIIPLYEQALGLPLYRQAIDGSAVNHEKCYGPAGVRDETESLIPLLQKVKIAHPEVDAISTGAILSDYQRTRVESAALRLGLVPLAYLWQWPSLPPHIESSLLRDMADVGQDARIIKVASGGLNDSFLWRNVADHQTISRLQAAALRFGSLGDGAVLGEGGEYETLTVSGPAHVWKGDIVFEDDDCQILPGDAGTALLRLRNPRLVAKQDNGVVNHPRKVPLFDPSFQKMIAELPSLEHSQLPVKHYPTSLDGLRRTGDVLFLPSLTGYGPDAVTQMHSIMDRLSYKLPEHDCDFSDVVYTTIIMRDMAAFPAINSVYGSHFTHPNPPARATIACAGVLSDGCHLALSMTIYRRSDKGRVKPGLHVQSRSYWAPANIGPYSQAIAMPLKDSDSSDCLVYIAGQIPLVPASMEVVVSPSSTWKDDFVYQVVLSLQHLSRIGTRVGARRWAAAVTFVVISSDEDTQWVCRILKNAWHALLHKEHSKQPAADEDEGFDVWNARNVHTGRHLATSSTMEEDDDDESQAETPPLHIIQVDALPRGCKVEWTAYCLTSRTSNVHVQEIHHLHHIRNIFSTRILAST